MQAPRRYMRAGLAMMRVAALDMRGRLDPSAPMGRAAGGSLGIAGSDRSPGQSSGVLEKQRIRPWQAATAAPVAPQGCVALCAPVPRTPLPRAGFAVAGVITR